jgi:hypothetical protein
MNTAVRTFIGQNLGGLPIYRVPVTSGILFHAGYYGEMKLLHSLSGPNSVDDFFEHGFSAGINPHPLVDVRFLQNQYAEYGINASVRDYFSQKHLWAFSSSPYIDMYGFLLSGAWNGIQHPLIQLLKRLDRRRWWNVKLMAIDAFSQDSITSTTCAYGYLMCNQGLSLKQITRSAMINHDDLPAINSKKNSLIVHNELFSVGKSSS